MKAVTFIVLSTFTVVLGGLLIFLTNARLHGYLLLIVDFIIIFFIFVTGKHLKKLYKK
jgi:hypothetical protein